MPSTTTATDSWGYAARLDSDGGTKWYRSLYSGYQLEVLAVAVDSSAVYVGGRDGRGIQVNGLDWFNDNGRYNGFLLKLLDSDAMPLERYSVRFAPPTNATEVSVNGLAREPGSSDIIAAVEHNGGFDGQVNGTSGLCPVGVPDAGKGIGFAVTNSSCMASGPMVSGGSDLSTSRLFASGQSIVMLARFSSSVRAVGCASDAGASDDLVVTRFDSNIPQWCSIISGSGRDFGGGVVADALRVTVGATLNGTASFPIDGGHPMPSGGGDGMLLTIDNSGRPLAVRFFGDIGAEAIRDIAADPNSLSSVVLLGEYQTIDIPCVGGASGRGLFIARVPK